MKRVKLFEQFINEGGWSTVKTQDTILNPLAIKKTVEVINRIGEQFNKYLQTIDLPPIDWGRPVGSGTWWEDDLITSPDKLYGDVDVLVLYPTLKLYGDDTKKNEAESVRIYNDELLNWLERERPVGVDPEETRNISNPSSVKYVVEIDIDGKQGWVQVDLVVSHEEYKDWALARLTPIRNVKGFVLGNLYSSFGEVLDLSVQLKGVRAKVKNRILVPYSSRAGVEEILVSSDIRTFLADIAKFFWENTSSQPFEPSDDLMTWKMNASDPSIEQLFSGIIAFANTLEKADVWGKWIKAKDKNDFLQMVVKRYRDKMMTTYNSQKFNKAESKTAFETIKKIRAMIVEYIKRVEGMVK